MHAAPRHHEDEVHPRAARRSLHWRAPAVQREACRCNPAVQRANHCHPLRMLRPRRQRPRGSGRERCAHHQDDAAPRGSRGLHHASRPTPRAGRASEYTQEDEAVRRADAARARAGDGDAPGLPAGPLQDEARHRASVRQDHHRRAGAHVLLRRIGATTHRAGAGPWPALQDQARAAEQRQQGGDRHERDVHVQLDALQAEEVGLRRAGAHPGAVLPPRRGRGVRR
mmetsp:Transcript_30654/g.74576  ORF Transcript_30654/g.74576 Transcript_30654/m.74576 type:complete len:226 (-) Transcript_30654:610-1287(-)